MNKEKKERFVLLAVISLIIVIVGARYLYRGLLLNRRELKRQITMIENQIEEARSKSKNLASLKSEYESLIEKINSMNKAVLSDNNLKLIRRLCDMAKESGVSVHELNPGNVETGDLSNNTTYTLSFYSSFADFYHFLRKCELNLPLNFAVEGVTLKSGQQGGLAGQMNLIISSLKE